MIHQTLGSQESHPHAGLRGVLTVQNLWQIGNTASLVLNRDHQRVFRKLVDEKLNEASARILKSVSRYLGDRGGDSRLVLSIKLQCCGELSRSLAGKHYIVL